MSKKVTYHMPDGKSEVFTVLAENANGTVDIGPEGGSAFVTECAITETPVVGSAVIFVPAKEPKEPKKDGKDSE